MGSKRMKKNNFLKILILIMAVAIPAVLSDATGNRMTEQEVYEIAQNVGSQYGICPELLQAIAFRESSYNPNAKNGSCIGLMQVSQKWHSDRMANLDVNSLYDPYENMLVAADYLLELFEEYGDIAVALQVYNGDSSALKNGYVSDYAKDIMDMSMELEREHGK